MPTIFSPLLCSKNRYCWECRLLFPLETMTPITPVDGLTAWLCPECETVNKTTA